MFPGLSMAAKVKKIYKYKYKPFWTWFGLRGVLLCSHAQFPILSLKLHSNLSLLNICSCCLQSNYLFLIPLQRFLISLLRVLTTEVHLLNIKSRMFSKIDTKYCRVDYLLYRLYTERAHTPQHDFPKSSSSVLPSDTPALVLWHGSLSTLLILCTMLLR